MSVSDYALPLTRLDCPYVNYHKIMIYMYVHVLSNIISMKLRSYLIMPLFTDGSKTEREIFVTGYDFISSEEFIFQPTNNKEDEKDVAGKTLPLTNNY